MDFEEIRYEVDGPLALLTIDRPDRHNAISLDTLEELHHAVRRAALDDDVRVIAITGAGGRAFASGSDLSEVLHRDFRKALEPIVQGLADQLERTPKAHRGRRRRYLHGWRARSRARLRPEDRDASVAVRDTGREARHHPGWRRHSTPAENRGARLGDGNVCSWASPSTRSGRSPSAW